MLKPASFLRKAFRTYVFIAFLMILGVFSITMPDIGSGQTAMNMGATEKFIQSHPIAFGATMTLFAASYWLIAMFGHRFRRRALKLKLALKSLGIFCCLAIIVAEMSGFALALTKFKRQVHSTPTGDLWTPHLFPVVFASISLALLVRSFISALSELETHQKKRSRR